MQWAEAVRELTHLGPYPSHDLLRQEAARLLGRPVSSDAVQKAFKRYSSGHASDLVDPLANNGANGQNSDHWAGAEDEWADQPATIPDSRSLRRPMYENARPAIEPRFTLFPGDIHCPIWDRELVFAVLEFAQWWGIDHLCVGGDLLDLYGASRFSKEGRRLMAGHGSLVYELRAVTGFYERCNEIFESIDWLLGNHEGRAARRFVDENLWLYDHGAFDPQSLFMAPDRWRLHDPGTRLRIGNVCFAHGHKLKGSGSMHSAANVLKWNPLQHTVYGHTHKAQQASHVVYDGDGEPQTYTATSCGHLSQLRYHNDYACQPAWEHAFAVVEHGPKPQIHLIRIQNRRWRWMGGEWGA